MALSGADRGVAGDGVSGTTFAFSPASNCTAGALVILGVAADNAEAGGVAHTVFTVTDSKSNTWTRRRSPLFDPLGASAGVEGGVFTTPQDGGTLTTGDTITVTFNVATVNKCWALQEATDTGQPTYVTGGDGTGANTATPTVTTASITSGNMVIGFGFAEGGGSWAGDADTDNGTWSTQQTANTGANMSITSQRKIVTATATQTYNPTRNANDTILCWIEIAANAGAGGGAKPHHYYAQQRQQAA